MVKNCDLGLENAALGLRPRAAFSRPRSQFFTIRTSQPANNIYFLIAAVCSFPRKIKIVIKMVQAVPRSTKGPGGTNTAINPI